MEDRVKLYVLGISYSRLQSGAFALILAEENGPFRIPVVIGAPEAQAIAMKIEGVLPSRPLTHDLFVSFTHAFGVRLREVFIYKFEDGVFYSELTFTDGQREVVIDSRTSDAIAIAMRTKAPIYTTRTIIDEAGFIIENEHVTETNDPVSEDGEDFLRRDDEHTNFEPHLEKYSIEELERTIRELSEQEKYEEAAKASEILNRKLGHSSTETDENIAQSLLDSIIDEMGKNPGDDQDDTAPDDDTGDDAGDRPPR